jgi:hypothetical protein
MAFPRRIELDDNVLAIARYITKYITKDIKKIFGNFYYAGGSLIRKPETVLCDSDYCLVDAPEYFVDTVKISFKYIDVDMPDIEDYPDDYFEVA